LNALLTAHPGESPLNPRTAAEAKP
jgi:hypothetical protein